MKRTVTSSRKSASLSTPPVSKTVPSNAKSRRSIHSMSLDKNSKSPNETLFNTLMSDPTNRALVLEMVSQNRDNIEKFKRKEERKILMQKKHIKRLLHCESPSALMKRRALEKKKGHESDTSSTVSSSSASEKRPVGTPVAFDQLLKGVVAYVEIRSNGEDRSTGAKLLMQTMGAKIMDNLGPRVTHVVFKDGLFNTYQNAKLRKVHLVSVLWLEAVRKNNYRVPEKNYPAVTLDACDVDISQICKDYEDVINDEHRRCSSAFALASDTPNPPVRGRKTALPSELRCIEEDLDDNISGIHTIDRRSIGIVPSSQAWEAESIIYCGSGTLPFRRTAVTVKDESEGSQRLGNSTPELTSDDDSECGVINGQSMKHHRDSLLEDLDISLNRVEGVLGLKNSNAGDVDAAQPGPSTVNVSAETSSSRSTSLLTRKSLPRRKSSYELVDMDLTNNVAGTIYAGDDSGHPDKEKQVLKLRKSRNSSKGSSCTTLTSDDSIDLLAESRRKNSVSNQKPATSKKLFGPGTSTVVESSTKESTLDKLINSNSSSQTDKQILSDMKFKEPYVHVSKDTEVTQRRSTRSTGELVASKEARDSLGLRISDCSSNDCTEKTKKKRNSKLLNCDSTRSFTDLDPLRRSVNNSGVNATNIEEKNNVGNLTTEDTTSFEISTGSLNDKKVTNKKRNLRSNRSSSRTPPESGDGDLNNSKGKLRKFAEPGLTTSLGGTDMSSLRISENSTNVSSDKFRHVETTQNNSHSKDSVNNSDQALKNNRNVNLRSNRSSSRTPRESGDGDLNNCKGKPRISAEPGLTTSLGSTDMSSLRISEGSTNVASGKFRHVEATQNNSHSKDSVNNLDQAVKSRRNVKSAGDSSKNVDLQATDEQNCKSQPSRRVTRRHTLAATDINLLNSSSFVTDVQAGTSTNRRSSKLSSSGSRSSTRSSTKTKKSKASPSNVSLRSKASFSPLNQSVIGSIISNLEDESPNRANIGETNVSDEKQKKKNNVTESVRYRKLYNLNQSIDETYWQSVINNSRSDVGPSTSTAVTDTSYPAVKKTTMVSLVPVSITPVVKRLLEQRKKTHTKKTKEKKPKEMKKKKAKAVEKPAKKQCLDNSKDEQRDLINEYVGKKQHEAKAPKRKLDESQDSPSSVENQTLSNRRSQRLSQHERKNYKETDSNDKIPITPDLNRRSTLEFVQTAPARTKRNLTQRNKKKRSSIVCTRLHKHEVQTFAQIVKKLKGFFVEDEVRENTTHLVVGESKRTINLLRAIARGCWVVKQEWMFRSLESSKWLPEEDFELTEFSSSVQQCRIQRQAFGPLYSMDIFEHCGPIYIARGSVPRRSDLQELIELCKGVVTNVAYNANVVVGEWVRYKDVTCVKELWILDSITANKKKSFKNYLIKPAG